MRRSAARCASAATIAVCASALPALAQQGEDTARLNARLFESVRKNDMGTVRTLLTQGADPMARDATGQTPAGAAIDQGYFEIAHYILSVRNQQQTQRQRDAETLERDGAAAPTASAPTQPMPPTNQSVREPPTPSWRANESKDRPTDIPSARLTAPRDAVVITPADPRRGKAAPAVAPTPQPAAAKSATTRLTPPTTPAPQLSNLPRLPSGAPNPFDPAIPTQPTLPVITATGSVPALAVPNAAPAAAPQAAPAPAATIPAPERKGINPFGRLWNGLTDWFSEREPLTPAPQPRESASVAPPEPVTRVLASLFSSDRPQQPVEALPVARVESPAADPPAQESATPAEPTPRLLASLFRIDQPQRLVEPLPVARIEPPAAAPQPHESSSVTPVEPAPRRLSSLLRIDQPKQLVEPLPVARLELPAAAPQPQEPSSGAQGEPATWRLAALFRIDQPQRLVEPLPVARVEVAAAAPQSLESPSVASTHPVTRMLTSLFRADQPQELVEPPPAARVESPVADPQPIASAPAATTPDTIARFFAKLFRPQPDAAQPATAVPLDLALSELALNAPPPLAHMTDEPLPLPIVADPAFYPTRSETEPKQEVASAVRAPAPAARPTKPQVDRLGDFLRGLFGVARSEPVAKPKAYEAPIAEVAALGVTAPEPETAPVRPSLTLARPSGPLAIEDFSLTRTLNPSSRAKNCFQKGRLPGWYCLETAAWPPEIGERMEVSSWVFGHGRVIVHYDNIGAAQSLYAIFPTEHFNHIVRFVEATLGPASSDSNRAVAMVGEPHRLNLITTWTRRENGETRGTVLEVRKFDTARGMVPDTRHGTLSLVREGTTPMFRYVAEADLMMQAMQMERDGIEDLIQATAPKR